MRGPAGGPAAAEERVHDVAEAAEPRAERAAGLPPPPGRQRVAAEVDDLALLGIGQHLVGARDLLEALLLRRVDVGVQLARQPAIRPLDLLGGGVLGHAEDGVVVGAHKPADQ